MAIVYLSSTRIDLLDERQTVTDWLIKARHEIRHSYRASADPVVKTCIADVEGSDIYLLLAGHRYGDRPAVDNPDGLSITELEFRAARAAGKPIVALFQANPPSDLSDFVNGDAATIASLKAFHAAVRTAVTPDRFANTEQLVAAVSTGVTEAVRKLEDKRREQAPPITPGVNRPHPRLLSRALLLVHAAGIDEAMARALADTLAAPGIGWRVERHACDPEGGIDWPEFERQLAECRGVLLLLTPAAASRFAQRPTLLPEMLSFADAQTGLVVAASVGLAPAPEWLDALPLRLRVGLDEWAKTRSALTSDLADMVTSLKTLHPDIDDPRLIGLQVMVVAMNATEANELDQHPELLDELGAEQRSYFADVTERSKAAGTPWTGRYAARRDAWQPFGSTGFADAERASAQGLVREVVQQINRLRVVPRRDQDALLGHRIRLRPYPLDPLLADDADWLQLIEQMKQRRCLILVDELSLCHPRIRAVAATLLADASAAIATIAPFDPPLQTIDAALRGNGVLQLGNLVPRFRIALDPQCELALASLSRLRRWLRVNVPETLAMFSTAALDERRAIIRSDAGID